MGIGVTFFLFRRANGGDAGSPSRETFLFLMRFFCSTSRVFRQRFPPFGVVPSPRFPWLWTVSFFSFLQSSVSCDVSFRHPAMVAFFPAGRPVAPATFARICLDIIYQFSSSPTAYVLLLLGIQFYDDKTNFSLLFQTSWKGMELFFRKRDLPTWIFFPVSPSHHVAEEIVLSGSPPLFLIGMSNARPSPYALLLTAFQTRIRLFSPCNASQLVHSKRRPPPPRPVSSGRTEHRFFLFFPPSGSSSG